MGKMIADKEAKAKPEAAAAQKAAQAQLKTIGDKIRTETSAALDPQLQQAGATSAGKVRRERRRHQAVRLDQVDDRPDQGHAGPDGRLAHPGGRVLRLTAPDHRPVRIRDGRRITPWCTSGALRGRRSVPLYGDAAAVRHRDPIRPGLRPARRPVRSASTCAASPCSARPHIGHLRSGVNYDVLRRWLLHPATTVTFIRNITDIDDKILVKAAEQGRAVLGHRVRQRAGRSAADYPRWTCCRRRTSRWPPGTSRRCTS